MIRSWLQTLPANDFSVVGALDYKDPANAFIPALYEAVNWLCRAMDLAAVDSDGDPLVLTLLSGKRSRSAERVLVNRVGGATVAAWKFDWVRGESLGSRLQRAA